MKKFSELPYERVDLDKMKSDYADLVKRLKEAKSGEEQWAVHQDRYKIYKTILTNYTIAHIRHDIDTTDEFYDKENEYYDSALPEFENCENAYKKVLFESPYRAYLEEKMGPVAFKNIELDLKSFDEKLIPLLKEENELESRYTKLIATAKIEFEGETYNLSLMTKFTTSEDRDVRKRAVKAMSDYFLTVTDEIDE